MEGNKWKIRKDNPSKNTTRSGDIMNSDMTFHDEHLCVVDSATMHTILNKNK